MSWFESVSIKSPKADPNASPFDARQAALLQLGAMSPLWMLFFSASAAGMAYWSMTRWMALGAPEKVAAAPVRLRLVPPVPKPVTVPEPVSAPPPQPAPALKTPDAEIAPLEVPVPEVAVLQASTPEIVTFEPETAAAAPEPVKAALAAEPVEAPLEAHADLDKPSAPAARKPRGRKPAGKA